MSNAVDNEEFARRMRAKRSAARHWVLCEAMLVCGVEIRHIYILAPTLEDAHARYAAVLGHARNLVRQYQYIRQAPPACERVLDAAACAAKGDWFTQWRDGPVMEIVP